MLLEAFVLKAFDSGEVDQPNMVMATVGGDSKVYMSSFVELRGKEDVYAGISILFGDVRSGLESLMRVRSAALYV